MKPYYSERGIEIYHGDCKEVLPELLTADLVITDPPYGTNVCEWDSEFPIDWMQLLPSKVRKCICISCGANNILNCPRSIGSLQYRWTLAPMIRAASTLGLMGFAAWVPWLCYARKDISLYKEQQDAGEVAPANGQRIDHPSPKPLTIMKWILNHLPNGSIIDPFCGSGTTLLAAQEFGRKAIGIEISERYCEIAAKRLSQGVLSL